MADRVTDANTYLITKSGKHSIVSEDWEVIKRIVADIMATEKLNMDQAINRLWEIKEMPNPEKNPSDKWAVRSVMLKKAMSDVPLEELKALFSNLDKERIQNKYLEYKQVHEREEREAEAEKLLGSMSFKIPKVTEQTLALAIQKVFQDNGLKSETYMSNDLIDRVKRSYIVDVIQKNKPHESLNTESLLSELEKEPDFEEIEKKVIAKFSKMGSKDLLEDFISELHLKGDRAEKWEVGGKNWVVKVKKGSIKFTNIEHYYITKHLKMIAFIFKEILNLEIKIDIPEDEIRKGEYISCGKGLLVKYYESSRTLEIKRENPKIADFTPIYKRFEIKTPTWLFVYE